MSAPESTLCPVDLHTIFLNSSPLPFSPFQKRLIAFFNAHFMPFLPQIPDPFVTLLGRAPFGVRLSVWRGGHGVSGPLPRVRGSGQGKSYPFRAADQVLRTRHKRRRYRVHPREGACDPGPGGLHP